MASPVDADAARVREANDCRDLGEIGEFVSSYSLCHSRTLVAFRNAVRYCCVTQHQFSGPGDGGTSPDLAKTAGGLDMSTVSNASGEGWIQRFDLMRRRSEYADVFATASIRAEVEAVAALARRGVVDLLWIRELFADRAETLVSLVRELDRDGLRAAYSLLFLEERLVSAAVREFLTSPSGTEPDLFVSDAIGDLIGAATSLERLARAWTWFMTGEAESDQ